MPLTRIRSHADPTIRPTLKYTDTTRQICYLGRIKPTTIPSTRQARLKAKKNGSWRCKLRAGKGRHGLDQFYSHAGHEQASRRPAIVLSPSTYNRKSGLALFCPITSRGKGCPFEVVLPDMGAIKGVILADEIKSLDWRARHAEFACRAAHRIVDEASGKVRAILEQEGYCWFGRWHRCQIHFT